MIGVGNRLSQSMKNSLWSKMIVGVWMSCLAAEAYAQEPGSHWQLRVMDMQNQVRVEATIRLSDETAESCMGGTWKRAVVEATTARAEDFFPVTGPLAYKLEHGVLTLGQTQVCDAYLFLTGKTEGQLVQGAYDAVGWSSKRLGSFSLQKIQ
jgi:hypothetical protein